MALAPLFPEEIQFQAKNGRNLTAGWLNVYLAGTDDVAETFCDYGVTRNPQDIVLDDRTGRGTSKSSRRTRNS